ncbi:MAG: putative membrane protein YkvI [Clostridium sp.]|jgi:uncharacterized membrane protein YkvI
MIEKINYSRVIIMVGAILAFSIGSGFATGQELIQYITAYAYDGILIGLIFFLIFGYSNYAYAKAGNLEKFTKGSEVYKYFCGNVVGTIFDYFSVVFCYMSFIVMVGGGAATLHQQYGLPLYWGGLILAALACCTVIFGLDALVKVLGMIGPVVVVICLLVGVITFIKDGANISQGAELVISGRVKVMKASTNWLLAGGSYAGFCMLWFGGFMAELGSKNKMKELTRAVVIAAVLNTVAILVVGFALLANVTDVATAQIPNLVLANRILPALTPVFAIIVFAAIYTTSVPLLWTASSRFATEKSMKFYIITISLAALGYLIAMKIPFNRLLNLVYVINGYGGIILLGFIINKNVRLKIAGKKSKQTALHD